MQGGRQHRWSLTLCIPTFKHRSTVSDFRAPSHVLSARLVLYFAQNRFGFCLKSLSPVDGLEAEDWGPDHRDAALHHGAAKPMGEPIEAHRLSGLISGPNLRANNVELVGHDLLTNLSGIFSQSGLKSVRSFHGSFRAVTQPDGDAAEAPVTGSPVSF